MNLIHQLFRKEPLLAASDHSWKAGGKFNLRQEQEKQITLYTHTLSRQETSSLTEPRA